MDLEFHEYIRPELLVLIPVLYIIGMGIKKSRLADKMIPLILGAVSVGMCLLWVLSSCDCGNVASALFTAITQGILIAGTTVYANQIYLQSGKEE